MSKIYLQAEHFFSFSVFSLEWSKSVFLSSDHSNSIDMAVDYVVTWRSEVRVSKYIWQIFIDGDQ